MKKTKKDLRETELKKYKLKASRLLAHKDYQHDYEEWKNLQAEAKGGIGNNALRKFIYPFLNLEEKEKNICLKYDIAKPYDPKYLKKVVEGGKGLVAEMCRIVDLIEIPLLEKDQGYIYLKIKGDEPNDLILYMVDSILTSTKKARKEYNLPVNNRRFRSEELRNLEAYRLRCRGKTCQFVVLNRDGRATEERRTTVKKRTFREIGVELEVKPDSARKSYYRGYELIHGTPYRKDVKIKVQKTLLKKECGTCKDRQICKELCPDVLSYVDQDKSSPALPAWKKTPGSDRIRRAEIFDENNPNDE